MARKIQIMLVQERVLRKVVDFVAFFVFVISELAFVTGFDIFVVGLCLVTGLDAPAADFQSVFAVPGLLFVKRFRSTIARQSKLLFVHRKAQRIEAVILAV